MAEAAITQVEGLLKACIDGYAPLSGWSVVDDISDDIAIDEGKFIIIGTVSVDLQIPPEQQKTMHVATVQFDVKSDTTVTDTISPTNAEAIAHIVAALEASDDLGGNVQDIEPQDVAKNQGKEYGDASLQVRVNFLTLRGDWFNLQTDN